jgi:hypothetical protein
MDRRDGLVRVLWLLLPQDVISNRQIEKVRREDDTIHFDFEDGSTMEIKLAGPASSVMVRDRDGKLE